mmetsp:Transcript_9332/g.7105  ORF Transcript_9332/g.7105 Transcript_9332/m.7105 type:complete len:111 (+) Transcript_9332:818-1150(+)
MSGQRQLSRNDPPAYQGSGEPYNPFSSSGSKGFQPYASQATPTSAFEYRAHEQPYSHRANQQHFTSSQLRSGEERRDPPYSGQKWKDPMSFDTVQTPNFDFQNRNNPAGR